MKAYRSKGMKGRAVKEDAAPSRTATLTRSLSTEALSGSPRGEVWARVNREYVDAVAYDNNVAARGGKKDSVTTMICAALKELGHRFIMPPPLVDRPRAFPTQVPPLPWHKRPNQEEEIKEPDQAWHNRFPPCPKPSNTDNPHNETGKLTEQEQAWYMEMLQEGRADSSQFADDAASVCDSMGVARSNDGEHEGAIERQQRVRERAVQQYQEEGGGVAARIEAERANSGMGGRS